MKPLVSVLIPVYNCEKYLNDAINSILNQSYSNLEILICDDASTDNSKSLIKNYNDVRILKFYNKKNIGYLKSVNQLFEKAKGDFITFQDADDWSDFRRIEKQIKFLQENSEISLCGTDYRYVNFDGSYEMLHKLPSSHFEIIDFISKNKVPPFCAATCMIRKDVYLKIGGYRSYFDRIGAEDFDWIFRIIENYKVANIPDVLYYYRRNIYSVTYSISSDLRHLVSHKIAFFLYQQRKLNGLDSIDEKTFLKIEEYIHDDLLDYKSDPSLIFRKSTISLIHKNQKLKALKHAFKAILLKPLKIINYKLLKYWFWKCFINRELNNDLVKQL